MTAKLDRREKLKNERDSKRRKGTRGKNSEYVSSGRLHSDAYIGGRLEIRSLHNPADTFRHLLDLTEHGIGEGLQRRPAQLNLDVWGPLAPHRSPFWSSCGEVEILGGSG